MPASTPTLSVKVDRELAKEYQSTYFAAFGEHDRDLVPLAKFMAIFVEDRVCEEIEFLRKEEGGTNQ